MFRLLVASCLLAAALAAPLEPEFTAEELAQNRNARYSFSSSIDDHISDLTHERKEIRDGLNVQGHYAYSDGYYKHLITYVADQAGYRIVKDEVTPLAGPKPDLSGRASVNAQLHGSEISYVVQSVPL